MLVLYGAQVIRVLLDLAELQAQSVDIVFTAKANDPALGLVIKRDGHTAGDHFNLIKSNDLVFFVCLRRVIEECFLRDHAADAFANQDSFRLAQV